MGEECQNLCEISGQDIISVIPYITLFWKLHLASWKFCCFYMEEDLKAMPCDFLNYFSVLVFSFSYFFTLWPWLVTCANISVLFRLFFFQQKWTCVLVHESGCLKKFSSVDHCKHCLLYPPLRYFRVCVF